MPVRCTDRPSNIKKKIIKLKSSLVKVVNDTYILQLLQVYFYAQIRILTLDLIETNKWKRVWEITLIR